MRPLVYCVDASSSAGEHALPRPLLGAHEDVELLSYDDASGQLLAVKGSHVFCYDASGAQEAGGASPGSSPPHLLRWAYPLQEGPPVRALRVSPPSPSPPPPSSSQPNSNNSNNSRTVLLAQRAPAMLEVVDLHSGSCSVYSAHRGKGAILGFFFTPRSGGGGGGGGGATTTTTTTKDADPPIDVVVVTTRAVEMCSLVGGNGLRMRRRERGSHAWCCYSHETGLLVVGGAAAPSPEGPAVPPPGAVLSAWQFSPAAGGVAVRLPRFELRGPLPAHAAARAFMPAAALAPPLAAPVVVAAATEATPPPLLPLSLHRRSSDGDGGGGGTTAAGGWGSPTPSVASTDAGGGGAAAAATPPAARPRPPSASAAAFCPPGAVRREDVALLRMRGRVLLAHVRRPSSSSASPRLDLYRVFADAVLPTYSLPLPREAFFSAGDGGSVGGSGGSTTTNSLLTSAAVAVVDDALVLLHPATGRATVLDAAPWTGLEEQEEEEREGGGNTSRGGPPGGHEPPAPRLVAVGAASSPLQWLSRGADGRWRAGDVSFAPLQPQSPSSSSAATERPVWPAVLCGGVPVASSPSSTAAALQRPRAAPAHRWRLFPPNVLVDTATNAVGRLTLDLSAAAAVAATATGPGSPLLGKRGEAAAALACFLQRRRAVRPAAVARAMRRAGRRQALAADDDPFGGGGSEDDEEGDDEGDDDEDAPSSPRELLARLCAAALREATTVPGASSLALSRLWGSLLDGYALAASSAAARPRAAAPPPGLPADTPPSVSVLSPAEIVARVLRPAAAAAIAAEQARRRSSGSGEGGAAAPAAAPSSSILALAAAAAELSSRLAARGAPPPPALSALQADLGLRAWRPRDAAAAAWLQPRAHAGAALAAHLEAFSRYAAQEAEREGEGAGEEEEVAARWEGDDEACDGCRSSSAAETAAAAAQLAIDAGQRHLSALEERGKQRPVSGGGDDDEAAAAAAIADAVRAQLRRLESLGLSMRARRLARAYGLSVVEVAAL